MLVPIKFSHIPVSQVLNQQSQSEPVIPVYQPDERHDFLSMVHVALKLRSDIIAQPSQQGLNVCKEDAIACVPDSLYMFIRLMTVMMGGLSLLEKGLNDCKDDDKLDDSDIADHDGGDNDDDENDDDGDDDEAEFDLDIDNIVEDEKKPSKRQNARVRKQEDLTETRVLSIAQDLVYNVSGAGGGHPNTLVLAVAFTRRHDRRNW